MREVSVSFLKEGNYKNYIESINNSDADYIHFDVMDGDFVSEKNLSVSDLCKYLSLSKKKNDVHLMVSNPIKYISKLSLYNIDYITIHREIKNYGKCIDMIKSFGFRVGLAINPSTDISLIFDDLDRVNLILVMGVNPGKSGQCFIPETSSKIDELKCEIIKRGLNVKVSVDGGVCDDVLDKIGNTDVVVSASYLLDDLNRIEKVKNI